MWGDYISISLKCFLYPGFQDCSSIEQFEKIENLYNDLSIKDEHFIVNTTGCLYPCNYLEYRVGSQETSSFKKFGLWITYGSVATADEREYYSYKFDSLVSDYGGSLGLFVGFSFFALWDIVKDYFSYLSRKVMEKTPFCN